MTTEEAGWAQLTARMRELKDLDGLIGLASWDVETYAPSGGRRARGAQQATLEAVRQEKLTDPGLWALLEGCSPPDPVAERMRARLKERVERARRLPIALVRALAEAKNEALASWQEAREHRDFRHFARPLAALVELSREKADAALPASGDRYDALLEEFEPGMTAALLTPIFEELQAGLRPLLDAVRGARPPPMAALDGRFEDQKQWTLSLELLSALGLDMSRARLDRSTHPFTETINEDDVRITTRIDERRPLTSVYSTIHECGHALYEQGFAKEHHHSPLAEAPSMGIHESQSRLWENQIARSAAFCERWHPRWMELFPEQLAGVTPAQLYAAVNAVRPGLIRVEADELSYNLHIMQRFQLERALLSGELPVDELPGAWADASEALLGLRPEGDLEGCLQDIHWALGAFGYFPSYALGNIFAAMLIDAYEAEQPALWAQVAAGELTSLLGWLREQVHTRGYLKTANETIREATGEKISVAPLLSQLGEKYGALYGL